MSSITKVSNLFKINISFPPQLLGDEALCLSVCAGVHVFMCILVYICNNLGKRQIKRAFIYKPCSVCCGSKLQSLSPVSGKSSVVPALEPPPDLPRILQLQWNLEGYHDTQVLRSCFTESFDYQDRL